MPVYFELHITEDFNRSFGKIPVNTSFVLLMNILMDDFPCLLCLQKLPEALIKMA